LLVWGLFILIKNLTEKMMDGSSILGNIDLIDISSALLKIKGLHAIVID
jgi:hypothetical protein